MPYDEGLAYRIREMLGNQPGLEEKKMFGGVGFMLRGNMACGVYKESLVVRLGPERNDEALARPHARPFDITGKPMKGWVMVAAEGCAEDEDLQSWVRQGVDFALTLPAK
jgi:TfoX/Sxy family transcriptional regulator of competence genes